jgi:hypothetical protein
MKNSIFPSQNTLPLWHLKNYQILEMQNNNMLYLYEQKWGKAQYTKILKLIAENCTVSPSSLSIFNYFLLWFETAGKLVLHS